MTSTAVELSIQDLGNQGDGIAKHNGQTVFVSATVTGDHIRATLHENNQSGHRGELLEILKPGPARRPAPCPHYPACGGCQLQHVELKTYSDWKMDRLREALGRHELNDISIEAPLISPQKSRRRATLNAKHEKGGV
jgi:23S rRNA (uracil1939-C5)-methyltransferase